MTHYIADFSIKAVEIKNSTRVYTHAWAVIRDGRIEEKGFSSNPALAHKAATAMLPTPISAKAAKLTRHWSRLAKDRGFANAAAVIAHLNEGAAARRAVTTIEVVTVRIA